MFFEAAIKLITASALAKLREFDGRTSDMVTAILAREDSLTGIARVNGRPQRQAKPLTEVALAGVFGLSASQIGRRINAAAKAAGLGDGFTGHASA